jgi:fructose-1,6-bisphosphatase/inositol monophosphatase family enzyme
MSALPDPAKVAAIIRDAALTEVLPRFCHLGKGDIREKKPGQLVTDADIAAEKLLSAQLCELLPAAVVGEEAVHADPGLLGALERPGPVWVIDPVDGTANFARGNPRFAVIVALVVDGRTVMGWIHDPVPDRTVFAVAGQGAWSGDRRLSVLPEVAIEHMRGSVKKAGKVARFVADVNRRGSAAHDYLDLVDGDMLHFAHFRRLMPWDHAAGVLIHKEAGGYAAMLNGEPYTPVLHAEASLLLTPGRGSWDLLKGMVE